MENDFINLHGVGCGSHKIHSGTYAVGTQGPQTVFKAVCGERGRVADVVYQWQPRHLPVSDLHLPVRTYV